MTTAAFLADLKRLGVELAAHGDRLRCSAPRGLLTEALRLELARRKSEILVLLRIGRVSAPNAPLIGRAPRDKQLPLSFAQQRLWFLDQLEPGNPFYNLPEAVRLVKRLNVGALEQTLSEIVRRHEVLRTTFPSVEGRPVQMINPSRPIKLAIVNLGRLSPAEQDVVALRLTGEGARRAFDLALGPMTRETLLRFADDDHTLLLTIHHIVSDGWSVGIFMRETMAHYKAFDGGLPSPLPELLIQYADYACWQRQWLQGEVLESQLSYWKQQLDGQGLLLELPTDHPRPAIQTYNGAKQSLELPAALSQSLKALSRKEGVTLFVTILAAFQTLLYRYTEQDDINVGSPIASRNQIETESLIGVLVNILVLRTDLSGNPTFRVLLKRVREMTIAAYAHQELPFERLVEELQLQRDLSRSPLFQVMLIFQNAPIPTREPSGLNLIPLEIHGGTSLFDLTLTIVETEHGLGTAIEYNTDIFDAGTISEMLSHLQTLLESIVGNPEKTISRLQLLTEPQRDRLLVEWNDTNAVYPEHLSIHRLFETQVERTPDSIAVLFEDQHLTYRELNRRANQLAHYLRDAGVKPEALVGLIVERSMEMLIGVLAILKAGGAYVPIDSAYPHDRISFMIEDSQMALVLTQEQLAEQISVRRAEVICLGSDGKLAASYPGSNPNIETSVDSLAYAIYTSGSTGQPKGVQITHRAVTNFLSSMSQQPGLTIDDVLLSVTTLSFDIAALELFLPLTVGARLVIASRDTSSDGKSLAALIATTGATAMQATPATWRMLVDTGWPGSKHMKILCGGEALPRLLAHQLRQRCDSLWNLYGPTETTIWSAISKVEDEEGLVSIGGPIANTQIHLFSAQWELVAARVPGELHIGGDGVARGYINRPELTADRFIPDRFSSRPGARLYKTGDLARRQLDGKIEFLGRIDHQVKMRGMRIELGEIEAALNQYADVRQAVVALDGASEGDKRLVSYLVADSELAFDDLRRFLKERLPVQMIPSAFIQLDALPLTPNGKVNRKALPAPNWSRRNSVGPLAPPRTPIEEALVGIWSQVFGVEQVGIHDGFFELGGHSLLVMQVVSRMRDAFELDIPLRVLFETTTIAGLAAYIEAIRQKGFGIDAEPLLRLSRNDELPLSFAQQRLWFIDQLRPDNPAYNICKGLRIKGPLNVAALEQVINEIVRRHEVLRTTFPSIEGRPAQVISSSQAMSLPLVDMQGPGQARREAQLQRFALAEAQRTFNLSRGPLLRATVLRISKNDHLILITMHHIVSDGWSTGVLVREVMALSEAFSIGEPSPLPELAIQYADFAHWQYQYLQGKVLERQLTFWKQQLEGAPTITNLPLDRPRPAVQTFKGRTQSFDLPAEVSGALKALSNREGVTLFMTLLAAFAIILRRYTSEQDLIIGTNVANRTRGEIEGLIGVFVNNLVLRANLSANPTFIELLHRIRKVCLDAYAHQDFPFEKLIDELQIERDLSHNPLFQVLFVLHNNPSPKLELTGVSIEPLNFDNGGSQFDLSLNLFATERGLTGLMVYSASIFNDSTIIKMLERYRTLLEKIAESPNKNIEDLSMSKQEETCQLIHAFNDPLA